ncbi:polysaccharide biosynthesis tyrosine autokinase [Urbifossiella limnaea]|uniref:Tyrosine-protein kinase ptk n=1 Tax=Urbifossiella limnaea TaxID=2528023 RepID=A0A517Y2V8_9BACT|nr:polysaccharide biosynthesis tyrosine autokinase [Urbifossiella limnaea]QDU24146.1 Tyrosine-protein kinase ptk [Urbifossiella limnaea]
MSQMPTTDPAAGGDVKRPGGISARFVLHSVRRRPVIFLGVVLFAGAVAAGIWLFLPLPKVTTAVVFHIASQNPTLLPTTSTGGGVDFNSYKLTQAALVKRRLTLVAALKDPAVSGLGVVRTAQPDAPTWLERNLKVDTKPGSEFMQVALEGDNGEELKDVLGAVAKAYLAAVDERENGKRRQKLARLEETNRANQQELERYRKRGESIALVLGSKDGPTLTTMDAIYNDELRLASREQGAAWDQQQLAERELAALTAPPKAGDAPPPVPPAQVDEEIRKDVTFQQFEAAVARAQQKQVETEALFQPGANPPVVVQAREAVKAAAEKRDQYKAQLRPKVEAHAREAQARAQQARVADLQLNVERHKARVEVAKTRVDEVKQQIGKVNQYRIELENLRRLGEQTEKMDNRLAEEMATIRLEIGAPPRVTLAEEAFLVPGIEGNRRLKYTLIGGVLAFAAGFAGLVGWEYRRRRVTHAEEVTTDMGVRLLGTVPPIGAADGRGPAGAGPALTEAIDTTRTMLLHGTPAGHGLRTVLVTSAVAGEGKTSLAGHLAISLARAGYRTVLVDGDVQSPAAHRLFGVCAGPGLCELLRGETDLATAVRPSPIPGLSVVPAGRWDLTARQAIIGDGWRRVKESLEAQFDFLVVDTAPLLLVSDTLLLARDADRVVLSVLIGVSQVAHVAETAGRLRAVGANLSGAVVNGVWQEAHRSAKGYGKVPAEAAV